MEDEIKALTEELKVLKAKEAEAERRLAELREENAKKVSAEIKSRQAKSRTFVSAKTARETAETTCAFKNHIAKAIDDTAKEGMAEITYSVWGICDAQVNAIEKELASLGYNVSLSDETKELIIKW